MEVNQLARKNFHSWDLFKVFYLLLRPLLLLLLLLLRNLILILRLLLRILLGLLFPIFLL
jgi:hypothetical protein